MFLHFNMSSPVAAAAAAADQMLSIKGLSAHYYPNWQHLPCDQHVPNTPNRHQQVLGLTASPPAAPPPCSVDSSATTCRISEVISKRQ